MPQEPERVGNTLITQMGYRGEWIGMLHATFDEQGLPSNYRVEQITLGPEYADEPEMAALEQRWAQAYPTPTLRSTPTPTPNQ
jgi:2',3'-cyclic-nucleotide 2'-phosphodiesterase (5'-nucleotidase family)